MTLCLSALPHLRAGTGNRDSGESHAAVAMVHLTPISSCVYLMASMSIKNTVDGKEDKTYAGLETFSPNTFNLVLTNLWAETCEDHRSQLWRWWTYQFTHGSLTHVGMNCFSNLLYGIPLEGAHGHVRVFLMYTAGIIGGAACALVNDPQVEVVGMSGGCYALMGISLADLVMNWHSKQYRYFQLGLMISLAVCDIFTVMAANSNISHSAHFGGYVTGALVGILLNKNIKVEKWERALQLCVVAVGGMLIAFTWFWSLYQWPPRDLWENIPWCWARQISDEEGSPLCIRCGTQYCIDTWNEAAQLLRRPLATVSVDACRKVGWYGG